MDLDRTIAPECQLPALGVKGEIRPAGNGRQTQRSLLFGHVKDADGTIGLLDCDLPAIGTESEAPANRFLEDLARCFRRQVLQSPGYLGDFFIRHFPDLKLAAAGIEDGEQAAVWTERQEIVPETKGGQPADFCAVPDTPNINAPRRVRSGVVPQAVAKVQVAGGHLVFPFLGDAQVGQGQGGDGLVAQFQEAIRRQLELSGNARRFAKNLQSMKALAHAPAQTIGTGLGHQRVEELAGRLDLGLLSPGELATSGFLFLAQIEQGSTLRRGRFCRAYRLPEADGRAGEQRRRDERPCHQPRLVSPGKLVEAIPA